MLVSRAVNRQDQGLVERGVVVRGDGVRQVVGVEAQLRRGPVAELIGELALKDPAQVVTSEPRQVAPLPRTSPLIGTVNVVDLLVEGGHGPVGVGMRIPAVGEAVDVAETEAAGLKTKLDASDREEPVGVLDPDETLLLHVGHNLAVRQQTCCWVDPMEVPKDVHA